MGKPLDHVHKYKRVSWKQRNLYLCDHPECTHREYKKFILGKFSICNNCFEEFVLDDYALKRAKPMCKKCRDTKDTKHIKKTVSIKDMKL